MIRAIFAETTLMPPEPRQVRFNRQTFEVRDERRIRGERYLVVGNYGSGSRPRESALQVLGKHDYQQKVILRLPDTQENWRRVQKLNGVQSRFQGSHLPFARISSFGKWSGEILVVLEHIQGNSLRHNLRMQKRLTAFQAIRMYSQLVWQLCNLYRTTGIIHGDIAPENIIVSPQGTRLVLIDFGSSFRFSESKEPDRGDGGRPIYQAPEQLTGNSPTRLSEQFSAASVFYEMLTRKTPFNVVEKTDPRTEKISATPPSENAFQQSDLPVSIWRLVDEHLLKALSLKPENRFQTIGQWQESAKNLRDISERPELAASIEPGSISIFLKKLFGKK